MADRVNEGDSDMARLKEELAKLGEDFRDLFEAAVDLGKHRAGTAKEKVQAGVIELKRAALQAKARGGEALEATQEKIKERPLTSVLIAFGVGLLLGKLLDRR